MYVHIPFCSALCPYCDFAVVVGKADLHEWYCDSLIAEAESLAAHAPEPAGSVFIGGGTPSLVSPHLVAGVLERLRALFAVRDEAEVSLEANPESVEAERMRVLREAGVNRVSIGAQSFDDDVLRALGRTHTAEQIARAVGAARDAGIGAVSLDLIYGGPAESDAAWESSLRAAIALRPQHLSCYGLTIEERTPFGKAVATGAMGAPDEDDMARRYERACAMLADAGYEHYEISNWALPGHASRHNLVYWTQGDYVGLGIGAHSHIAGQRWWNTRALRAYLADPTDAREGTEALDDAARAAEWLSLRMRLIEGIDLPDAERRLGRSLVDAATSLAEQGLARLQGERLTLTTRGMLLENEVTLRLLG